MLRVMTAGAVIASALATSAQAATIWATSVTDGVTTCSVQENDSARSNVCNALGVADGDFAGGRGNGFFSTKNAANGVTFSFGQAFTGPITFYEITGNGNAAGHTEYLDFEVFATTTGGASILGTVTNLGGTLVPGTQSRLEVVFDGLGGRAFTSLFVKDASGTSDGFDIDAISAQAVAAVVPLPAGGVLLLSGLAALWMGRRKAA